MTQKTRPANQTQINTLLASGTKITAATIRQVLSDLLDSSYVKSSDGISGITGLQAALDSKESAFEIEFVTTFLTPGQMEFAVLDFAPVSDNDVQVFFNGLLLSPSTDYTIGEGREVTATSALNVAYGGTGTDGLGFDSTDEVKIISKYIPE